jgi:hypothetical protein
LGYRFFGLGTNYRIGLHEEIFSLCYYGQGGFTWSDVYNLPIYLRKFYIKQIVKIIEEKNKKETEQNSSRKRAVPTFRTK